jgi:hypothetical protein
MVCLLLVGPLADYEESMQVCDARKTHQRIRQHADLMPVLVGVKSPMLIFHIHFNVLHNITFLVKNSSSALLEWKSIPFLNFVLITSETISISIAAVSLPVESFSLPICSCLKGYS